MTAVTEAFKRNIKEDIKVAGTNFTVALSRDEWRRDDNDGRAGKWEVILFWQFAGFYLRMAATRDLGNGDEKIKYQLVFTDTFDARGVVDANSQELAGVLSPDERRLMLGAIEELNGWQKMNPHLPELGNWIWRLALDAKLSEGK